jgi:hypothetical protein
MTWQPIETAPKDTPFLAYQPAREFYGVTTPAMMGVMELTAQGEPTMSHIFGYDHEERINSPTHWMPLPQPPKESEDV